MIQGIHHTSFTVSDLDAAERFFVGLIGMQRIGGGVYNFDYVRRSVGYPDATLKIAVLAFTDHQAGEPVSGADSVRPTRRRADGPSHEPAGQRPRVFRLPR